MHNTAEAWVFTEEERDTVCPDGTTWNEWPREDTGFLILTLLDKADEFAGKIDKLNGYGGTEVNRQRTKLMNQIGLIEGVFDQIVLQKESVDAN